MFHIIIINELINKLINGLINDIIKIFKRITFVLNSCFIIFTELTLFTINQDYSQFIDNLTCRLSLINILYVKLFQAIALNNNLIDETMNNKLLKFTDNVPWSYSDIKIYELIEISNKYNIRFENGYDSPINSGMISLVFKGILIETNTPVIIKMKRKNIEQQLKDAIDNLKFLINILEWFTIFNKYNICELINKNIVIITTQTKFKKEIENIIKIKENCKNIKYVKIPEVYSHVTEEYDDFIMMEYINGLKINQIEEIDYEGFAKQVMKFGFVTTIVHGVTHGDLHSGNILFIKDENDEKYKYKIGVLDFGIIYELDNEYKVSLFELLTEMFTIPVKEGAIKLLESVIIQPRGILHQLQKEDYDNIVNMLSLILNDTIHVSKKANQIQIYNFLSKFKEYIMKPEISTLGIKLSDNFVKTQLVLAMSHGITLSLCKDNFIDLADSVINELFYTNLIDI